MPMRQLTERDSSHMIDLCRICMPEEDFSDISIFNDWFPSQALAIGLKQKNKKLTGFIFGIFLEKAYYIMCICIHPNFKKRGFGRRLVSAFLLSLPRSFPVWCKIHKDNHASFRLFKSCGFVARPKKEIPDGLKKSFRTPYYPFRFQPNGHVLYDYDLYKEITQLDEMMDRLNFGR